MKRKKNIRRTLLPKRIRNMLFLLPAFLLITGNSIAQEYEDIESNDVRIDPDWTTTYESGEFAWTYDIATDKNGNIYTTGYFKRSLKVDANMFYPGTKCYASCPPTSFLMKHDPNGKRIWIRYGLGSSVPYKIAFDNKGDIYIAGVVHNDDLFFTSTDTNRVKLERPKNTSGIFICKYNADGKVLKAKFLTEKGAETPNDFLIDNKNNLYIGGEYDFRNYDKKNESRKGFLLVKLNENWETIWKQKADTVGQSSITSMFLDKTANVYVTGNFRSTVTLGNRKLTTNNNPSFKTYQYTFAAKFNDKGQVQWALDSIGKHTIGSGKGIVCDKKGNTYVVANSGFSNMYFSKIDADGRLVWYQSIVAKSTNNNQTMLIDDADNIYMAGEGYGAVFGSTGPELFSYKSKGSLDFFVARYNTKGECIWLKAGGGKNTDNCKSMAIYKNSLILTGWFASEMTFVDTVLKSKSSYIIWLAKFDLKNMAAPAKKTATTVATKPTVAAMRTDPVTCECYQSPEHQTGYTPSVNMLASYDDLTELAGWQVLENRKTYDAIRFRNLQQSNSVSAAFYGFTAIAAQPIRIISPYQHYGINLTPCNDEKNIFELPVTVSYTHGIKQYIRDFEYREFDSTARSYLSVLMSFAGIDEKELLSKVLYNYTETDLSKFTARINKAYKTNIKLEAEPSDENLRKFIAELQQKKINLNDFVLNEFILSEKTTHKINPTEEQRLQMIFSNWLGSFTIDEINRKMLRPEADVVFSAKNIAIEIDNNIIRQWDALQNKPATDKTGKHIASRLLADVNNVRYTSSKGLSSTISRACFTRSEIAGTGILVSFSNAALTDTKQEYVNNIEFGKYPLFLSDSSKMNSDPVYGYVYRYHPLLVNFTGLLVKEATINIPFKNTVITTTASDIILNNKLISGAIYLQTGGLPDSKTAPVKIQTGADEKITVETTLDELASYFTNTGLEYRIDHEGKQLKIHFKKLIP